MQVIRSLTNPRDPQFQENYAANAQAVAELAAELARSREGGGEPYVSRHVARGRLLPRERIERLIDRDGYFLELCALAGREVGLCTPGAALIGGVGVIAGVECLITANDSTVQGGAVNEIGVQKTRRLAEIAAENRLPAVSLIESAGADLPNQSRIFVPGGEGFRDLTRRSAARIPTICLVFGSSTAGGAYIPGMSDYAVFVRDAARVFLAGPPLVKMATGEVADEEGLGGAAMHSRVSGVSDFLAEDELDALRIGRELVAALRWRKLGPPPGQVRPPRYDPDELLGIVSPDFRKPFPAREVLARVLDDSALLEFKPEYGRTLVCGFADLHGYRVGVLANDGVLFSESANKGAQFIALCNQQDIPLVFFQNITGFMVGRRYEEGGIIKNGAKMINAVSNSTVPALTVMMGASFGAGNYAMMGRAYRPRFCFSWPNHRIAVMGGEQLAGVLEIVRRDSAARKGRAVDEEQLALVRQMITQQIDSESSAYYATARLWDDGILDPRDTRAALGVALSCCHSQEVRGTTSWGVFRH